MQESHPEVCFARLNGSVLHTSKHDMEGIRERVAVIADFLPKVTEDWIVEAARNMKCNADDNTKGCEQFCLKHCWMRQEK